MLSRVLVLMLLIPIHFAFAGNGKSSQEGHVESTPLETRIDSELLLERINSGQHIKPYIIEQTAFLQISLIDENGKLKLIVGAPVSQNILDQAQTDRAALLQDVRFRGMTDAIKKAVTSTEERTGVTIVKSDDLNPANWNITPAGAHITAALELSSELTPQQLAYLITELKTQAATCRIFLGDYQTR